MMNEKYRDELIKSFQKEAGVIARGAEIAGKGLERGLKGVHTILRGSKEGREAAKRIKWAKRSAAAKAEAGVIAKEKPKVIRELKRRRLAKGVAAGVAGATVAKRMHDSAYRRKQRASLQRSSYPVFVS